MSLDWEPLGSQVFYSGGSMAGIREGSLEAPTRHVLDWKNTDFYNQESLYQEMERVFDICHGCRRCVNLCNAFPTLFDLVDESDSMELDTVNKQDFWNVVEHCYLCDLCYMTKCPYVPPHDWAVDFPHLMLRAKAVNFKQGGVKLRDKVLTSTDAVGKIAGIPVIAEIVNASNKIKPIRKILDSAIGIAADATLPDFHSNNLRKRLKSYYGDGLKKPNAEPAGPTKGQLALFSTCYMNRNEPGIGEDFIKVFEHNNIAIRLPNKERCCGMPKMELGDFETLEDLKNTNIPELAGLVDQGWDLTALIPSCVLMFKQELPLIFPDDPDVMKVKAAFYDPFEYLMLRHKHEKLRTDFKTPLGKVSLHASCHQRVQNIGQKTREVLALIPDTEINIIERCSGHDGTYAVKSEFHQNAMKIVRPVVRQVTNTEPEYFGSDCVMAGHHIENALNNGQQPLHPMAMLRKAYGI